MIPLIEKTFARIAVVIISVVSLSGCYYTQAARGQLDVMRKREPIADVIADVETSGELADRLRIVWVFRTTIAIAAMPTSSATTLFGMSLQPRNSSLKRSNGVSRWLAA
jgi:predicted aminopeptidase